MLARRTRISFETAHRGVASGRGRRPSSWARCWAGTRRPRAREIEHYLARVAAERESQRMPDDLTADAARLGAPDVRGFTPPVPQRVA